MNEFIHTLWTDESGQDLAEYGLLIALVAVAVVAAVTLLGDEIANAFGSITDALSGAGSST